MLLRASMQAGRKEAGFSLSVAIAGSWVPQSDTDWRILVRRLSVCTAFVFEKIRDRVCVCVCMGLYALRCDTMRLVFPLSLLLLFVSPPPPPPSSLSLSSRIPLHIKG